VTVAKKKRSLPPALQANAERMKKGERPGRRKTPKKTTRKGK
jgi:hypothetical protein